MATNINTSNNNQTVINLILKIVSFNMQGFNQGHSVINSLIMDCMPDVFLLQEHWLTPANLDKFNLFNNYYFSFGCSAMHKNVESGMIYEQYSTGTLQYQGIFTKLTTFSYSTTLVMFLRIYTKLTISRLNFLHFNQNRVYIDQKCQFTSHTFLQYHFSHVTADFFYKLSHPTLNF